MGKETGFLEYERKDRTYRDPEERLTHYKEFVVPLPEDPVDGNGPPVEMFLDQVELQGLLVAGDLEHVEDRGEGLLARHRQLRPRLDDGRLDEPAVGAALVGRLGPAAAALDRGALLAGEADRAIALDADGLPVVPYSTIGRILADNCQGKELLRRIIITEAIASILDEDTFKVFHYKVLAYLGVHGRRWAKEEQLDLIGKNP